MEVYVEKRKIQKACACATKDKDVKKYFFIYAILI